MKKKRRILSTFLAACMVTSSMVGMSVAASAGEETSSYTITIPATLNVSKVGWNPTDGISATGTLANEKKLTVTASSANGFKLKSGSNEVGYTLTTAEGGGQTTSWEFDSLSSTATTKPLGIIVEDYSDKPAGTYQDTVTFTAKVKDAATVLAPALENGATVEIAYRWNPNWNNTTTFTFTNNSGTYTLTSKTGESASDFNGTLTKNGNTLALSITNSGVSAINLAINFDTTNDTYSFVTKNSSWYISHTVRVNGTDITSQLTQNT